MSLAYLEADIKSVQVAEGDASSPTIGLDVCLYCVSSQPEHS